MGPDELRVERLHTPERLAVARITGTAENHALHAGQTEAAAHAAITAELQPHADTRRRLILAHAAAAYIGGAYPYETVCVALLQHHGTDLDLALRIAIHRTALPVANIGNADRRRRLLAMQSHLDPQQATAVRKPNGPATP